MLYPATKQAPLCAHTRLSAKSWPINALQRSARASVQLLRVGMQDRVSNLPRVDDTVARDVFSLISHMLRWF
jgi:hypothetical protein